MRHSRLYIDQRLESIDEVELDDRATHYLTRVLRLRAGHTLSVFNGTGGEWLARVKSVGRRAASLTLEQFLPASKEATLAVHLGVGLLRGERMDWLVQKATELGISELTPLQLSRCTARSPAERTNQRLRHWRQIAISACEQCGRDRLPAIHPPLPLGDWLQLGAAPLRLVMLPTASPGLPAPTPAPRAVTVLVGPEGGFDESELAQLQDWQAWSLGPRVLRGETAALAALAVLQYQYGDLGAYSDVAADR